MASGPYQSQRPKKSVWPWIVGILALLILLLCAGIVTTALSDSDAPAEPRSTPTTIAPPANKGGPSKEAAKVTTIKDGSWKIGEEFPGGTYRTDGAAKDIVQICVWDVRSSSGSIADAGTVQAEEPGRVHLEKGDEFTTTGCKVWVRQ